jgi:hypothetical protein
VKTHLDVRSRESIAREPVPPGELAFHEPEVQGDLRPDVRTSHLACDRSRDGPCEERHRPVCDPIEDQLDEERRHGRAFRVVQPVRVPEPLIGIARRREAPGPVSVHQILDDRARFGEGPRAVRDDG